MKNALTTLTANSDGFYMESSSSNGVRNKNKYDGLIGEESVIADLLDSKGIVWEYEPHCFRMGGFKGIQPDFYLPEHDLYIEACSNKGVCSKFTRYAILNHRFRTIKIAITRSTFIRRIREPHFQALSKEDTVRMFLDMAIGQRTGSETFQDIHSWEKGYVQHHYPGLYSRMMETK